METLGKERPFLPLASVNNVQRMKQLSYILPLVQWRAGTGLRTGESRQCPHSSWCKSFELLEQSSHTVQHVRSNEGPGENSSPPDLLRNTELCPHSTSRSKEDTEY